MQRTSPTKWITSLYRTVDGSTGRGKVAAVALLVLVTATVSFWAGRSTTILPSEEQQWMEALRTEVQTQQRIVDRLLKSRMHETRALAVRLAELQAASTRLDALGERLAQMGQLTLEEFDFSEPPPMGGPTESVNIDPADGTDLHRSIEQLSQKLRRQSGQLDALQYLMMNRQLEDDMTPSGWPVKKGWISSRFGERNDPFTGERTRHNGVDFVGKRGSDVLSVAAGVVIWAGRKAGYGYTVEIDHGNGYQTRYAHSQELKVQPGDRVVAGDVIALLGDSGRTSAPHVHFEVLRNGVAVDPAKFVGTLR